MKSSLKIKWKLKNNFFIKQNIAFLSWTKIYFILGDIFFKDSQEFNYLSIFFAEADTKKHRYALAKGSNAGKTYWLNHKKWSWD